MKNRFLFCLCVSLVLLSCKVGYDNTKSSGGRTIPRSASPYNEEAPKTLKLPLLNGGAQDIDVVQGRYIVKTVKDFDKSIFVKMGAQILSAKRLDGDSIFWHVYKNDSLFLKKILRMDGVLSAEYDFAVHHIRPPKKDIDKLKPILEDEKNGGLLRPLSLGLEDGKMEKDPRTNEVNYSLQITKALDAYKELKDHHFKKPVLLGIIDTGFNYCNEDFWFDNSKGQKESIAYFVRSPFLPGVASKNFDTTLGSPVDENNHEIPYAKKFLEENKYSGRLFEVPCTKVNPSSARSGWDSPDSAFFWNWDDGEHGTHCTGMMAAIGDNGKGVAGVSWKNTKIASYKCFGGVATGWEIYGSLADYADYIERGLNNKLDEVYPPEQIKAKDGDYTLNADCPYATEQQKFNHYKDQGVYPVNMSLGGPFPNEYMATVIVKCLKNGVLPVVAMGNDGQRLAEFPASFEGVLSVGATDGQDKKKHFSCSGEWIDICAPGDGILSTGIIPGHNYPWGFNTIPDTRAGAFLPWDHEELSHSYTTMSGTSMATPFMTGVLGYLLSFENARNKNPGWLKAIVQSTADPLEGQNKGEHHEDYGYGRVNVLEAGKAVVANKDFTIDPDDQKWNYNTKRSVTIKLKNKRCKAPDNDNNIPKINDSFGLSGHPVIVYEEGSGNPKGFTMTNNKGEATFFFLSKGKRYVARVNIEGEFYEESFEVTDNEQRVDIWYDSAVLYISTFNPHSSIFKKYSPNGEYDDDVDTIITIYEDGNFDEPIDRYDYLALDSMPFNAKPGKTYFAEITCFADPNTGDYRTGIYGLLIGYDSLPSVKKGNNDFDYLDVEKKDNGVKQPTTGRFIYELIHGMDCWEPNDSFEEARKRGCFMDFAKKANKGKGLQTYVVCCLTNQSDGLDRDIFMFKAPEWDED